MRRIFVFWLLFLTVAAHAAPRYHLVRIVVTGSNRYNQEDIVRASGLAVNSQVSLEDLQQAGSRLGNCGAFSSVQFQYKGAGARDSVEADFQVKDADKFYPVVLENFLWLGDAELQQALRDALPLYNGSLPASGTLPDDLKAVLSRVQTAKGLPADVSYMLYAELGQAPSAYKFKIENANLKISDFHFSGAGSMAAELLLQSVAAAKGQDYFRSDTEKMLALSVLPIYRERGYLKAAVAEARPSLENGGVVVTVSINEGDQYRLAGFSWSGNTLIASADLAKIITLKPGDPVNVAKLSRDLALARKLFFKFGHEGAAITPRPSFTQNMVTYTFEVKEGEQYHMGSLRIEGFDADTSRKLTEAWKLPPGAPYDGTYVQQFLIRTLPLAHGRQTEWKILEHLDDVQKIVNVQLHIRAD